MRRKNLSQKAPALLSGREPSVKEQTLLSVVSMNAALLSNRLASEKGNDRENGLCPSLQLPFLTPGCLRMEVLLVL